jgi:hypothetical protein
MQCDRSSASREIGESIGHSFGHTDNHTMLEVVLLKPWTSALGGFEDREAWWQTLRAQVQLPDAVD